MSHNDMLGQKQQQQQQTISVDLPSEVIPCWCWVYLWRSLSRLAVLWFDCQGAQHNISLQTHRYRLNVELLRYKST